MTTGAQLADLVADHNAEIDEWVADNAPRYLELREQYARDGIHRDDVSPSFWSWVMYTASGLIGAEATELPGLDDLGAVAPLARGLQWSNLASLTMGVAHVLAMADSGLLWRLLQMANGQGEALVTASKGLTRDEAKNASPIGKARFAAAAAKRQAAKNG